MNAFNFTFSDLIAGYVTEFEPGTGTFGLKTSDGREFAIRLTEATFAELIRNLGGAYADATAQLGSVLEPGRFLHAYGVFYPEGGPDGPAFEAKHVVLFGRTKDDFRFENEDWWLHQIGQLGDFYLAKEFANRPADYQNYRTNLTLEGDKTASGRQETDTISRMVYGLATAYMMTGLDRYLDAAVAGVEYLIKHLCFVDRTEGIAYWYHAVDIKPDGTEQKIFASEFGDDFDAIPCYEQIYALAGLAQVYRLTGEPRIREYIDLTINLFHKHYEDKTSFPDGTPRRGYYSHLDPITLSPLSPSLDDGTHTNRDRKNWNSVGDHIPAYLINLYLATGDKLFADFLEDLCDTVVKHFPDYEHSPFVQEKFFGDWTKDQDYGEQKNRAIVGHNLKIAWNLMRVNNLRPKKGYVELAERIASLMPRVGGDPQRGGWYDMVERELRPGEKFHRLVWHDRKAWWQQEQGILAYLILDGVIQKPEYEKQARESSAFYNAWILDTTSGGVYFNVLANGHPYALGGMERSKGSHSEGMYHSGELALLAAVYSNLLCRKEPMDFYFRPQAGAWPGNVLRVAPDLLPPNSVKLIQVWINGQEHKEFDPLRLTVTLPASQAPLKVRVRLEPASVTFSADTLDTSNGTARIALAGSLGPEGLGYLEEQVSAAIAAGCHALVFDAQDLVYMCEEAVRYLALTKQHQGPDFSIRLTHVRGQVKEVLSNSELDQEVAETAAVGAAPQAAS